MPRFKTCPFLGRIPLLALCLIVLPATTSFAQIYKWVDANGKVHYSDQKPPSHAQQAQDMTSQIDTTVAPPDEGELRRRAYLKSAEQLPARRTPPTQPASDSGAARESLLCWRARVHAEILKLNLPIYRSDRGELRPHWFPDSYEGPRTYISDAERPRVVTDNQQVLNAHCADPQDQRAQKAAYNAWLANDWCDSSRAELVEAQAARTRSTEDRLARLQQEVNGWCGSGG